MAEFDFEGLLGNVFGGGGGNALDEYLTPEQRRMMQRNAMLAASAALLKAGGESTRRIGIGEALGGAFEAGQAGYEKAQTGALTQMALKTKLDEAKRAKDLQKMISGVFAPQAATPGAAPMPMPEVDTGVPPLPTAGAAMPPAQAAAMPMNPNVAKANQYRQVAKMLEGDGQLEKAMLYQKFALELDPQNTSTGTALSKLIAERAMLPAGSPLIKAYDAAIEKESQFAPAAPKAGTLLSQLQADLAGATDPRIKQQIEARIQKEINNPPPAQNIVNINEGQKGFENEMKLGGAFRGEPIYKDFNDMKSAYGQVIASLDAGTPIGDVAGATKIMKLLDPGSVVRESELGIAMAAAGRMDRLQNYFNNLMTGQKLTPTQRQDFKTLSNELYAVAGQAYNNKRSEYKAFGDAYKFPNLNTSLGAPADVPSIIKPGSAPGARPADIQSIIDQYRRTR
jgi:hypothetical protein